MEPKHYAQNAQRKPSIRYGTDGTRPLSSLGRTASDVIALAESNLNGRCARKLENIAWTIDTVGRVIDGKIFEASLDKFLPRPLKDGTPVRKRLRDAQFRQLAEFCNRAGHPQWGLRPRTFAVLRMIGCPEVIEYFIEEKLTDIFLPYSEDNLPSFINGQVRWRFLDCQNYVLNGRAAALEKPGEPHQNVDGSADECFVYVEDLGAGGFGQVDSVIGEMSLMKFARKRIKRHRLYSKDKARLQVFENELKTLKLLSHRHLVRLVGSYTDSSCVGLIMTPVADMNLATYLKETTNQESRKICLRRFFGCLATALSYLHSQHVQHKDIKPANILVKQQTVYLTDFGTSRSWENESSKTTQGTVLAFTPRYCAPEVVQFCSSRNESRDIWSLGCVFFEMCSVLADHTVEQMWQFFKDNGTHGEYIRENNAGAIAWVEKLRSSFTIPQDQQPLEIALRMCTIEPQRRPLAKELISIIFDFDSPPRYYGLCCDDQCYSNEQPNDRTLDVTYSPEEAGILNTTQGANDSQEVKTIWPTKSRYQPPTVDDPTEEMTVRAFFPPADTTQTHILEDVEEPEESTNVATSRKEPINPPLQIPYHLSLSLPVIASPLAGRRSPPSSLHRSLHKSSADDVPHSKGIIHILRNLDSSQLPCPWPTCSQKSRFHNREILVTHLRQVHGTHELFWTPLLCKTSIVATTQTPDQWLPGQIISEPALSEHSPIDKAFVLKRVATSSAPSSDLYTDCLRDQVSKAKRQFADKKTDAVHHGSTSVTNRLHHQPVIGQNTSQKSTDKSVSFSLLPEYRRPEPINSESKEPEFSAQEEPIVSPELLPEPFISSDPQRNNEPLSIPRSSLVPSYFLAMTNRLSRDMVDSALSFGARGPRPPPLFVYGSLMFPSVFRARAARFISVEGIYSRQLQRRISTSAEDWSSANESLQHAAQQMTPALLKGYQRFEIQKSRDAALIKAKSSNPSNLSSKTQAGDLLDKVDPVAAETKGFVIFGLSYEALACLDYLFSSEGQEALSNTNQDGEDSSRISGNKGDRSNSDSDSNRKSNLSVLDVFYRKNVKVTICTSDGKTQRVEASTYVWHHGSLQRFNPWNLNRFVRCKSLRQFSTSTMTSNYDWVPEERVLAAKMGMMYAMLGDELCDKVLKNDVDGINLLAAEGCDFNASCHHYGTPLQAAAAKGNEKMVYLMVKFLDVDPNIEGGKYHSPLVAAISEGHEDVVQTLLRYGANPLARSGSYISPIYQAVSFEDVEMARLLLEKGAWLSKDYQELLDLAAETGNKDLCDLLQEYDIRNLHKRKRVGEGDKKPWRYEDKQLSYRSDDQRLTNRPSKLLPALVEMLRLKGEKGKWTGMKAIKVLRICYADEVPEGLLDLIEPNLKEIQKLLTSLIQGGAHERSLIEQGKDFGHTSTIKVAGTSDDNPRSWPTPSSRRHPQHSQDELGAEKRESGNENEKIDEAHCLTCDGHGGRKGTGRQCSDCRGRGHIERSPQVENSERRHFNKKCRACSGTGNIFSERDRCRACNVGNRWHQEPARDRNAGPAGDERGPEFGWSDRRVPVRGRGHRREYLDPPPPYSGRR